MQESNAGGSLSCRFGMTSNMLPYTDKENILDSSMTSATTKANSNHIW